MSKRNKTAGHNFEREVIKDFVDHGWETAVSSRSESRRLDAMKVDICYTNPFSVQCKNMATKVDYHAILESMPKGHNINVIAHKFTKKANKNFLEAGKYVIMTYDDFFRLADIYQEWIVLKGIKKTQE